MRTSQATTQNTTGNQMTVAQIRVSAYYSAKDAAKEGRIAEANKFVDLLKEMATTAAHWSEISGLYQLMISVVKNGSAYSEESGVVA